MSNSNNPSSLLRTRSSSPSTTHTPPLVDPTSPPLFRTVSTPAASQPNNSSRLAAQISLLTNSNGDLRKRASLEAYDIIFQAPENEQELLFTFSTFIPVVQAIQSTSSPLVLNSLYGFLYNVTLQFNTPVTDHASFAATLADFFPTQSIPGDNNKELAFDSFKFLLAHQLEILAPVQELSRSDLFNRYLSEKVLPMIRKTRERWTGLDNQLFVIAKKLIAIEEFTLTQDTLLELISLLTAIHPKLPRYIQDPSYYTTLCELLTRVEDPTSTNFTSATEIFSSLNEQTLPDPISEAIQACHPRIIYDTNTLPLDSDD